MDAAAHAQRSSLHRDMTTGPATAATSTPSTAAAARRARGHVRAYPTGRPTERTDRPTGRVYFYIYINKIFFGGARDLMSKRCEDGKLKVPSFGLPAEGKVRWCAGCARGHGGAQDLKSKRCEDCELKQARAWSTGARARLLAPV